MIAGNPKVGRKLATLGVAVFVAVILVWALLTMHKKTVPMQEPPMLPSVWMAGNNIKAISGWNSEPLSRAALTPSPHRTALVFLR